MSPLVFLIAQVIAWQWQGASPPSGGYQAPVTVTTAAITCTFVYDDPTKTTRTSCASRGRELWHHDETGAFVEDATLVIDGATLYSARYRDISHGCTLHAFDTTTGHERWSVNLVGLGLIAHSKYHNAVELRVIGGRPVVFGWESAGRYIESRDAITGASVFHQIVP